MNESDALKRLLTDQTRLYAGDRVPVRFAQQPHYAGPTHGGPYLAVNPDVNGWYNTNVSGANELRLLRDTLSHEGYEYRMGHPSAKEAFMRRHGTFVGDHPSPKAMAAGNVYNILRDAWVNTTRCRDFPGLRRTFAFKADLLAGDDDVSELPPAQAVLAGLHQISLTNTANGIRDADPEVRSLLATARRYVERCRTAQSHEELAALADAVFGKFEPLFEDLDEDFEDMAERLDDLHPDAEVEDMSDEDLADAIDDAVQNAPDDADLDPEDAESANAAADVAVDMSDVEDADPESGDGAAPEDLPSVDADDLDDETVESLADAASEDEAPEGDESHEDAPSGPAGEDEGEDTSEDSDGATGPQDAPQGDDESDDGDVAPEDAVSAGGGTGGDSTEPTGDDDGLLEDMDRLDDDDRAAGDMMGLDDGDDYHEPDSGDEARYEQIQHAQAFAATDWAERMDQRDDYGRNDNGDMPADDIQQLMRETGLARDLRRAFQRIKTAEVTETTTSPTSKLDLTNVVRHMAGDYGVRDVYQTTKRGASGGRTICAVMDASGSMGSDGGVGPSWTGCIVDAKVVLAALHLAAHEIGDDVVATAYDSSAPSDDVRLVTGPDETFAWDHLDGFTSAGGSTPTAAGVMDGIRLLERKGGKERVMVVITDGGANTDLAGTRWESMRTGDGSVDDARMAVETARNEGISVIGVGVGTGVNARKLERTFGPDSWIHVESDDLVDEVVRIYREQLDDDRVAEGL